MRSIWSIRKKEKAEAKKQKLRFKRMGHDGRDPVSRQKHEERVISVYGRTTSQMAASTNLRTQKFVDEYGPMLLEQRCRPQSTHPSLTVFRTKFLPSNNVHHERHFITVARDNLKPKKYLKGGGVLDLQKSQVLSQSSDILTETQPLRLIQPVYRQPEYPLRERDPTRDLGPSGGSTGGFVYKGFTDAERLDDTKRHARPTLADNGSSPWNEAASRSAKMPSFRDPFKIIQKKFRSSTAPGGFRLTELHPARAKMQPMALDEPWAGSLDPKTYAVHNDHPEQWSDGQRFYSRSNVDNYQLPTKERVSSTTNGLKERMPGFLNTLNYERTAKRNMGSTLVMEKGSDAMAWDDGSEKQRNTEGNVNVGRRGYFASARLAKKRSQRVTPW